MNPHLKPLSNWLLDPHPRVTDLEKIQRSRLLSTIILTLTLLGLIILTIVLGKDPRDVNSPEVQGTIILLGILLCIYIANRLGYNRFATAGTVISFTMVFIYISFYSSGKSIFLAFLMIPILLTAIFFSFRWTAFISASILVVIFILLSFQDQVSATSPFWTLRNMWFFLIVATGLLLTFMRHLGNLEELRQRELKQINEQLEREIAELERFTYTVSHELKTPLVTIKGFLGSVERDIQNGNLEKAQKDFRRISKATDNLHNTLSDLLELSRIGHVANRFEEFSLSDLVQDAIQVTEGRIRANNVTVKVAPDLPQIYGDRKRLSEVFENLIDNAAKYTGGQNSPVIEIGMREEKEPVFYVKDNGMGIDPQYHTKIFGLFDKLDSTSEGTGVGLTLIKRIIETHGGKLWVESEGSGRGTTFCFTIPDGRNI